MSSPVRQGGTLQRAQQRVSGALAATFATQSARCRRTAPSGPTASMVRPVALRATLGTSVRARTSCRSHVRSATTAKAAWRTASRADQATSAALRPRARRRRKTSAQWAATVTRPRRSFSAQLARLATSLAARYAVRPMLVVRCHVHTCSNVSLAFGLSLSLWFTRASTMRARRVQRATTAKWGARH